ncbi:MAG: S-methyl-5-thioribose-1-phosphate isomerase [Candidatus Dadabacteria bacterium]|nr:S-methyl-5-thioribose-1-phosphate isomerase [Candidatus Dadabacteria bacterium]MCZ6639171.1 S-methyl-5-thioribose-1-phosphate isomerase [Candidatus Dadabacteria bacterium]
MSSFKTIEWKDNKVIMIDQTKLPNEEVYLKCQTYEDVADAIKRMVIRGAPAIGVAAAMGIALGAIKIETRDRAKFLGEVNKITDVILATRPTAVNLFWAGKRMLRVLDEQEGNIDQIKTRLVQEANNILEEDIEICHNIGRIGAELIKDNSVVLTHCNAGALATAGYGTALGVVRCAYEAGKNIKVIATETRPFLQGARLTAWELHKDGIPVSLITDNMVGHIMSKGMVDAVVIGADRIARNGDFANKIGTYSISVLAKSHGIPFYVAAPISTIDYDCPEGSSIPIEERNTAEVTHILGNRIAPDVNVYNPAFDITPSENVSSIITEKAIVREPFTKGLSELIK